MRYTISHPGRQVGLAIVRRSVKAAFYVARALERKGAEDVTIVDGRGRTIPIRKLRSLAAGREAR